MTSDAQTKFFVPQAAPGAAEASYREIKQALVSQFRLPITDRRIFAVNYTNSKKHWYAEVGALEEQEDRYEILAIFESKQYIVFTRSRHGAAGPIILIDKTEVTDVEDFAPAG